MTDTWIDRVKAADAEAEKCYEIAVLIPDEDDVKATAAALIAIAAELRAARIARRPGAGQ